MSLAAGEDGNELQLEKLRLNVSSCSTYIKKNDINSRGLFSLRELRLFSSCRCSKIMFGMDLVGCH